MNTPDINQAAHSRKLGISFVGNLRDLGGYRNMQGQQVAWRRIFRSAELKHRNIDDVRSLQEVTRVKAVLDLRGSLEIKDGSRRLLADGGVQYCNIPLVSGSGVPGAEGNAELLSHFRSIGEFYLYQMGHETFGQKLVEALGFVADSANQPVIFHCALGKDRTGILSAAFLSILGISDPVIVDDYYLTTEYMADFKKELRADPQRAQKLEDIPAYLWDAPKESMAMLLSETSRQYGSFNRYLQIHGAKAELFDQLRKSYLTPEE